MCGITGWIDFDRDLSRQTDILSAMTGTMARRGPDDTGSWVSRHALLGHRRLAIIDAAGGRQPMVATRPGGTGTVVLTYSGEVYNFSQLRAELVSRGQRFTTRSDTEVVLRAYLEWGPAFADRLVGMFAFAIWDTTAEELWLVRDPLGVKPLYYYPYPGGLLFGSEPKAILANPMVRPQIRESSLPMLFNARFTPPGETPLVGLHEVRPGHILRFTAAGRQDRRYWQLESHEHRDDLATTVRVVRDLLEQIVTEQLVADVPLAALLSGGLDSTAIVAIAARRLRKRGAPPMTTFSVDFAGADDDFRPTRLRPDRDTPYALTAAGHLHTDHTNVVLDDPDVASALPAARTARDLPGLGQFDASMCRLFAAVRERCTVALSGEAADEIFGGYPWFHDASTVSGDTFPWLGSGPQLTDCLAPDVRRRASAEAAVRDLYRTLLAQVPRVPGEAGLDARMREVLYLSMQAPLGLLLDRKDRMSMAVGLEARVPFCDHRLVQYVWDVPWSMKSSDGREKSLLRAAVADLLPPSILHRRKSAYPASFSPVYAAQVRQAVVAMVDDADSPLRPLLDRARVLELVADTPVSMAYANAAQVLIPLVEVDRWMRDYSVGVV